MRELGKKIKKKEGKCMYLKEIKNAAGKQLDELVEKKYIFPPNYYL